MVDLLIAVQTTQHLHGDSMVVPHDRPTLFVVDLPLEMLLDYQRYYGVLGDCIGYVVRVVLTLGRASRRPRKYELFMKALLYWLFL